MHRKHLTRSICLLVAIGMCLTGCSSNKEKSETSNTSVSSGTDVVVGSDTNTSNPATEADTEADTETEADAMAIVANNEQLADLFSKRDLKNDYDETETESIVLKETTAESTSDKVKITNSTITIYGEGIYVLTGTLKEGMVIVEAADKDKVQLVLDNVDIHNSTSAAIYVKQADKVFVTSKEGSNNKLSGGTEYVAIDDNNIDATIFSKSDLTLNGLGSLEITSESGHGAVSKDDLKITSGNYTINANKHGLSGKDSISIADGTFAISCKKDGLHSENSDDETKGNINIVGGTLTINAEDDGIHAGNNLAIYGGTTTISDSYEGLEGLNISIVGGDTTISARDDGINAAGGNDGSGNEFFRGGNRGGEESSNASLNISGGMLRVNSDGDGLDSNGSFTMSGGMVYVDGPTNAGNGALDYNSTGILTGGTIIAVGAAGMAQSFTSVENQGAILSLTENSAAGTEITLNDSTGKELISYTSAKSFSSVVISTPEIKQGETYTLKVSNSEISITMDELNYVDSSAGMGGPGGHGGQGMPGGNGGPGGFGGQDGEMNGQGGPGGHGMKPGMENTDGEHERPNWDNQDGEVPPEPLN